MSVAYSVEQMAALLVVRLVEQTVEPTAGQLADQMALRLVAM